MKSLCFNCDDRLTRVERVSGWCDGCGKQQPRSIEAVVREELRRAGGVRSGRGLSVSGTTLTFGSILLALALVSFLAVLATPVTVSPALELGVALVALMLIGAALAFFVGLLTWRE